MDPKRPEHLLTTRHGAPAGARSAGRHFAQQRLIRDRAAALRKRCGRLALKGAAALAVLLMVVVGGLAVKLRSNLQTAPLALGADSQTLADGPIDILLMGTDTRAGGNGKYGGQEFTAGQGHSDVMMLLHISSDRQSASVLSFPRDTLVPLPACRDPKSGRTYPAQDLGMLNYALSYGGPGCTVSAINKLTGLNIDHFMMADFTAVRDISSAVGGVDVCLTQPVKDSYSGLDLPAGISNIQGEQALSYLRTRHGFTNGGDIGRIRAQQSFMASLARKVKDENLAGDLPKMYGIADAMTSSLTVDEGLTRIPTLIAVARLMSRIPLENIAFVTAPTKSYAPDPNRLELNRTASEKLFASLRGEKPLTEKPAAAASPKKTSARKKSAEASSSPAAMPSGEPTPTPVQIDPALVPVEVFNGLDDAARASDIVKTIRSKGFQQALVSKTAQAKIPASQIYYGDGWYEAAQQMAKELSVEEAQIQYASGVYGVQLVVGQDLAAQEKPKSTSKVIDGLQGQTAEQVTCQQGNASE